MQTDSSMTPAEFALCVRAAAEQRHLLIPRRRDRQLTARQGGKVLHAIDTDVVVLYINPWQVAVASEARKQGYAEIFPGEDRELTIALGAALAEFVFHRLSPDLPLIMLPPMGEEVSDVFNAVARNAEREGEKAFAHVQQMRQLVDQADRMADAAEAVKALAEHAGEIARFLRGREGAVAELRRFGQLLRSTRIAPPEFLLDHGLIQEPIFRAALEPPTDLVDRFAFRELQNKWFALLRKEKSQLKSSVLTDADAQVLARLEWINDRLAKLTGGDKGDYRVVLITGDPAVHAAASLCPWRNSTFGDRFLRHPKSYLSEPGVLAPPEDALVVDGSGVDTQFDQWLDTWLSELYPGTDDFEGALDALLKKSRQELIEWVAPLVKTRPQVIDEFRKKWTAYTRNLVLHRQPSLLDIEIAGLQERSVIEAYRGLLGKLEPALDERIRDTWEECFSVIAEGSYSLLRSRSHRSEMRSRNAPLLTFDRFLETRRFVDMVLQNYESGGLNAKQWDSALRRLEEDEKSGYVFYLALGVLFAAEGIWRVSAILANRALSIAGRVRVEQISGREAAFLRAVALRHCARRIEDLGPVAVLLEKAEKAYKRDLAGHPGLKAGPERFRAEYLALLLTYHLFARLLNSKVPTTVELPSLADLLLSIDAALASLAQSTGRSDVVLYTQRNLLVNWCMTAFLLFDEEGADHCPKGLAQHLSALEDNLKDPEKSFPPSYYVEAVRHVAAYLIAEPGHRKARREQALRHLRADWAKDHSVMRYDEQRFAFLRDLVEKRNLRHGV